MPLGLVIHLEPDTDLHQILLTLSHPGQLSAFRQRDHDYQKGERDDPRNDNDLDRPSTVTSIGSRAGALS